MIVTSSGFLGIDNHTLCSNVYIIIDYGFAEIRA